MANKIIVEFEVTDKGTLKLVTQDTEKLTKSVKKSSKATEQAGSSKNRYNKMEKGTAQLTSNTTKSFAKQAQTIGSGLVPAYATLAANIFAVSAAFGALKRAAGLAQLEAGLIAVGSAAGQNLPYIADQLREITGAAISTQSAMESVALGTSAGFSTTQMEELTRVAKGASLALGRDMEDAMSRLVRGAAKLEPEILDELGIMIRLDDVTSRYAENIGKTTDSLTQFERRMAFTNAIIDQGIDKFGQIAEKIDPNPYNQLAARFADLTKNILQLINTGLGPFLDLLANNTYALIGAVAVFGTSVASKMLPAMFEAGEAAADAAENLGKVAEAQLKNIDLSGHLPKSMEGLKDKIKEGTLSYEEQGKVVKNLGQSQKILSNHLKTAIKDHGRESEIVAEKTKKLQNVTRVRKDMVLAMAATNKSEAKATQAAALEEVAHGRLRNALKLTRISYAANRAAIQANMQVQSGLVKSLSAVRIGLFGVTSALKLAGTAFLRFLPLIGFATMGFSAVKAAWDKLFGKSELEKQVDEVVESFEAFKGIEETLAGTIENIQALAYETSDANKRAQMYTASLKVQAGVYDQIVSGILKVISAEKTRDLQKLNKAQQKVNSSFKDLSGDAALAAKEGGEVWKSFVDEASSRKSITSHSSSARAINVHNQALKELEKAQKAYATTSTETNQQIGSNILANAVVQIKSHDNLTAAMSKNLELLEQYQETLADPNTSGEMGESIIKSMKETLERIKQTSAELEGMKDTARSFDIAFRDSLKVPEEPFANIIGSLDIMVSSIENAKGSSDNLNAIWQELPKDIKDALGSDPDLQGLKDYVKNWKEASTAIANAERNAKKFEDEAKKLEGLLDLDPSLVDDYYKALDRGVQAQITALEKHKELFEGKAEAKERILEIDREIAGLETKLSSVHAQNITLIKSHISQYQTLEKLSSKVTENTQARLAAELSLKEEQLRMIAREDGEVTAREEIEIFEELKSSRIEAALREAEIKKKSIDSEYLLAELQFELLRQEFALADMKMPEAFESNYRELLEQGKSSAIAAVEAETQLALQMIESTHQDKFNSLKDAAEELAETFNNIEFDFDSGSSLSDVLGNLGDHADIAKGVAGLLDTYQQLPEVHNKEVEAIEEVMKWRQEALENAGQNAVEQTRIYSQAAEKQKQIERDAARSKLAIYSQYVVGVGGLLSSLAETQDATTKEGFEQQKNMQIAAAVVNTAGAIMNALATVPYPASIGMAAAAAATGAMQIAKIKSTKFGDSDSGGSGIINGAGSSSSSSSRPQTSGTVLGDPEKSSESISNVNKMLESIHAKEYRELRGIRDEIGSLNNSMEAIAGAYVRSIQDMDFDQYSKGPKSVIGDSLRDVTVSALNPASALTKMLLDFAGWGDSKLGSILLAPLNFVDDLLGGVIDGLFGKTSQKVSDYGIGFGKITGEAIKQGMSPNSQTYTEIETKTKSWFGSEKSTNYQYGELPSDLGRLFDQALGNIVGSIDSIIDSIGTSADKARLMDFEFDLGGRISFKGLSGEEIQKKVEDIINTQMDLAIDAVLGDLVAKYQKLDEGLFETAVRLMATKEVFAQSMSEIGNTLDSSIRNNNERMVELSVSVVEAVGGIKEFQKAVEGFTDTFFNEFEKYGLLQSDMQTMVGWMRQIPDSREGMKNLIQNIDVTTEYGERMFAELMSNTEKLDEYYSYLEKVAEQEFEFETESVRILQGGYASLVLEREKELEALRELHPRLVAQQEQVWALQELEQRRELELEIMYLSGDGINAITKERENELKALAPSVRAVQKQVWALEDLQSYQDQQIEILNLLGKEEEAVAMERKEALGQLTDIGKQLQMQIYDITDYIDRTETLANAEDELAKARDNASKSITDLMDKLLGSDKSPVQSMEYYETKYSDMQGALSEARTPEELNTAVENFTRFSEDYLDFMAAYGGNYKDAFNSTMGVLEQAKQTVDQFSTTFDAGEYSRIEKILTDVLGQAPSSDRIYQWLGTDLTGESLVTAIVNSLGGGDLRRASSQSYLESMFGSSVYEDYKNSLGMNLPGYATGGYHSGGWRIVGEDGPELEFTGSSRIYSNNDSTQMITDAIANAMANNGNNSNVEVKVYVGTRELKDYHVEWHRSDPETHKAVRKEVR